MFTNAPRFVKSMNILFCERFLIYGNNSVALALIKVGFVQFESQNHRTCVYKST